MFYRTITFCANLITFRCIAVKDAGSYVAYLGAFLYTIEATCYTALSITLLVTLCGITSYFAAFIVDTPGNNLS